MCTESENLTAYLDDELDPPARARFEAHLPGCASCPAELALLRGLAPRLAALPSLEPSPELRRRLLTQLPPQRRGLLGRLSLAWAAPLGGLAAVAAVAALVLLARPRPAPAGDEALLLAQNLELYEDLEAAQSADLSDEDLEVVAQLDTLEKGGN